MEALELFKIRERMCKQGCKNCPVSYTNNGFQIDCLVFMFSYPEKFVELTEKWGVEHQFKTRKRALKELFPKAQTFDDIPIICPGIIENVPNEDFGCGIKTCAECRREYWEGEYVQK